MVWSSGLLPTLLQFLNKLESQQHKFILNSLQEFEENVSCEYETTLLVVDVRMQIAFTVVLE
ncbi:hypothetical protein T10_1239 [Trichinella papuae]|uniref:Uncharacterized protein n=1 Tax=Trichinella papuae TaxID=268474 RepID=A0A0V1M817_9BILA|nr:hypothetical protein T10_1239 [Trichinella papuae]